LVNSLKPVPMDHAAWSGNLLKAAESPDDKPEVQARIYAKAYELGTKRPAGHEAAIRAARAIIDLSAEKRAVWSKKLLDVFKRKWRTATGEAKNVAADVYGEK